MKKNQLLCLALAALLALCCVSALAESAAAPVCQQPTKDGKLHGHWYGEWFPTRVKHHTAFCRYDGCGEERETSCERITLSAGEATTAKLCPVCGGVDGVRGFAAVAAQVTGVDRALPQGEAIVRAGEWNGQQYLTVAFEYGGRLRCPLGAIRVTLPADIGAACTIVGAQESDGPPLSRLRRQLPLKGEPFGSRVPQSAQYRRASAVHRRDGAIPPYGRGHGGAPRQSLPCVKGGGTALAVTEGL